MIQSSCSTAEDHDHGRWHIVTSFQAIRRSVAIFAFHNAEGGSAATEHLSQVTDEGFWDFMCGEMPALGMFRVKDHVADGVRPPKITLEHHRVCATWKVEHIRLGHNTQLPRKVAEPQRSVAVEFPTYVLAEISSVHGLVVNANRLRWTRQGEQIDGDPGED